MKTLGTAADTKQTVKRSYETGAPQVELYLQKHDALTEAEGVWTKEHNEATAALLNLDQPYREARAVVAANCPDFVLPETLKTQPTDTDAEHAVTTMADHIHDHAAEPWAADLLAGEFIRLVPGTLREVHESIDANTNLARARDERLAAFGPAWDRYLKCKRIVREAYGNHSVQYHRIHLRSPIGAEPETPPPTPEPTKPPETK